MFSSLLKGLGLMRMQWKHSLQPIFGKSICTIIAVYADIVPNPSNVHMNEASATIMEHIKGEAAGVTELTPPSKVAIVSAASTVASNGTMYLNEVKDGLKKLFSKLSSI